MDSTFGTKWMRNEPERSGLFLRLEDRERIALGAAEAELRRIANDRAAEMRVPRRARRRRP